MKTANEVEVKEPEEWICQPGEFRWLPEREYQELWFELRSWSWNSLAVLPTVRGRSEFDVAERLVVMGTTNTSQRHTLINVEGVGVGDTDRVIAMIRAAEDRGDRVIVTTDSIVSNPAATPILRAVNAVIPVVRLGKTDRAALERCVAVVGRARVLGVVTKE
jgi:3-deoxy-D-manno-octulosonic-acid transferase